jgi:hypothetical protein
MQTILPGHVQRQSWQNRSSFKRSLNPPNINFQQSINDPDSITESLTSIRLLTVCCEPTINYSKEIITEGTSLGAP